MTQDDRYQPLFEPMRIGPVTAPNRFYQVPHCTGMGHALPQTLAAMRGIKAEGGWGVVCTEYCSIHPSSDDQPHPFASLWDDGDVRNLGLMAERVHAHGALAGVELWHGGSYVPNLATREPPIGVQSLPSRNDPVQSRRMDRRDIRRLREWHRAAALRARDAGFDIVYVYPAHGYLLSEFLSRTLNTRADEYGGSLANRVRLVRELVEETRDAVGDRCAVAVRFSADGHGDEHMSVAEAHDAIGMLAELPDLWDFVVADYYGEEMAGSRFLPEASLEAKVAAVRKLTTKPVVSVGRFTSPDTMLRQLKSGVLDFVGAARPSIADPFLPAKIREDRLEDIRECIGCNFCYAHNYRGAAVRCTQNPTMGEEWRKGWHPERVPAGTGGPVLVVGAGPAGLEAAMVLGQRGYEVSLAESSGELGGRVALESRLPGLAEWGRVRDYRVGQVRRMANVAVYLESPLKAADVREFGADRVLIATGATWRADGRGRTAPGGVAELDRARVFTPDDLMQARLPADRVVVYDDDNYYMGPVLAQLLARLGAEVTYVTTSSHAGYWSEYTGERPATHAALLADGVRIVLNRSLERYRNERVELACVYSGEIVVLDAEAMVLVTSREPQDALYRELVGEDPDDRAGNVQAIGDCAQPALIAHAVYSGHRAARELDADATTDALARDRLVC